MERWYNYEYSHGREDNEYAKIGLYLMKLLWLLDYNNIIVQYGDINISGNIPKELSSHQ